MTDHRPRRTAAGTLLVAVVCLMALVGAPSARADVVGWGGRDVTFTPPSVNGTVNVVAPLTVGSNAGKYLIGGTFTDVGGVSDIDYVAMLNADGTLDTAYRPPTLSTGSDSCVKADGTTASGIEVLSLMEVQSTSGTATAGSIYIGGNFTNAGSDAKMDYLIRTDASGNPAGPSTDFYPTDDGTDSGSSSYTNCVHTMFTADGSAPNVTMIIGSQSDGYLTKKVLASGADAGSFVAPSLNGAVTSGFYCTSCSSYRIVVGGRFTNADGNSGMSRLLRASSSGVVGGYYATSNGTSGGVPLFDDDVNSIALTSSQTSILVGGSFSGHLAKVSLSSLTRSGSFTAPTLNAVVTSVAVDPQTSDYLFGGAFTNGGSYPACDYVCVSNSDGEVTDADGRSFFAAPPPNAPVVSVAINFSPGAQSGKYLVGGTFTDLGGNTATDRIARLNHSTPSTVTLNSNGGTQAGGADGVKTVYSNGQWQVYRENTGQLYEPTTSPPDRLSYSQIALSLTAPGGGGYTVGPSSLDLSRMNIDFDSGYLYRPWDSVTATGGSTGSGTASSDLSVEVAGRTYVVHLTMDYVYPTNYVRQTYTVDVPAENPYNVKLYTLYDSYLGGSDNGPGFHSSSPAMIGVSGADVFEALRYVSGPAWAGYSSAHYYDVVFGNDYRSSGPHGPGFGNNLPNDVITDPANDNAFGVNWNFGSSAGTTEPAVYDFVFSDPATAVPTSVPGQVRVSWSDPPGLSPAPTDYVVTALEGAEPTGDTCTATPPTRTCDVNGLDPEVAYTFMIDFQSGENSVFTIGSNSAQPTPDVPDAPTVAPPTRITGSTATVAITPGYNGGAPITGYDYSLGGGSWQNGGAGPTLTIGGLTATLPYELRVRARNVAGSGDASTSVTIGKAVPATPGAPTVRVTLGATVAQSAWTAPSGNSAPVSGYRIQVVNGGGAVVRTCVTTTLRCTLGGLPQGVTLRARVAAANIYGYGDASELSSTFTIVPSKPGPPVVGLVSRAGRRLTVSVRPQSGGLPTSYTVRGVGDVTKSCVVTGSGGSCSLLGLSRDTAYSVRARATNAGGASLWGPVKIFRTLP